MTTNEILQDMFTQFSEISFRFIHADRAKCVKCLLFPDFVIVSPKNFHRIGMLFSDDASLALLC